MRLTNILLITILLLIPTLSFSYEITKNSSIEDNSSQNNDNDIIRLIEKAKNASSKDRLDIEKLIKRKIAQAHRNKRP